MRDVQSQLPCLPVGTWDAWRYPMADQHAAFETSTAPMHDELRRFALRLCRDREDARDLVQETLLRALVAWPRLRPDSHVRAWLFRILTNAFINSYRKRRHWKAIVDERPSDALTALYGREHDHVGDPRDALEHELCDEVKTALDRLAPEYRDVVERADLRGEKYKEIADALEAPIGTVMNRIYRARRVLEVELTAFAAREYGFRRAA